MKSTQRKPDSAIKTYQQEANFKGLDWSENETLGKEGLQLLEKTEFVRRQNMLEDGATIASSIMNDVDSVLGDTEHDRRRSIEEGPPKVKEGSRRVSIRSIRTNDGGEHEATELESARKKLKRHIIAHDGASSVELWRSSLTFFRASRILLWCSPVERVHYTAAALFESTDTTESSLVEHQAEKSRETLEVDTARITSHSHMNRGSYASKLVGDTHDSGETDIALTDVTNTPLTPMILQKPTHRKGGLGENSGCLDSVTDKLSGQAAQDENPLRFVRYQEHKQSKAAEQGRQFRDTRAACHLPKDVMDYILQSLLSDREIAVMSEEQREAAIARGQDRDTLMVEREWLKKDESAQTLMLLDSIDCLAYRQ